MGNCFNKNREAFPSPAKNSPSGGEGKQQFKEEEGKLNNLLVMAEEEIKTYSGHGGLPNLVSLAEEESKNIKSPERVKSSVGKYEEILSSPVQPLSPNRDEKAPATNEGPSVNVNLAAFDPEDSHLFDSDKARLVMIDEFSEEEVTEEEEIRGSQIILRGPKDAKGFPPYQSPEDYTAPLATADC